MKPAIPLADIRRAAYSDKEVMYSPIQWRKMVRQLLDELDEIMQATIEAKSRND